MSDRRAVVTGGYGFVGSYLTNVLLSEGWDVLVVDNFLTGDERFVTGSARLSKVDADITRPGPWQETVRSFRPKTIFHLAAIHFIPYCNAHPSEALDVNVVGTQNVFDCASDANGVVFASSAAVYGISDNPHREAEAMAPTDIYGLSKKVGEEMAALWCAASRVPVRAARLFNVYGPNETNPHLIPEIMHQAKGSERIELGNIDTKRDYIFAGDIVSGLLALHESLADGPLFESYNVGTGYEYSARDVIAVLSKVADRNLEAISLPAKFRPSDRPHLCADNSKLRGLGWQPAQTLETGIAQTWNHFLESGFIKCFGE